METADKIKYWNWCADKYWQYQKRQEWAYAWHGDTLVRFHELAMPDPDFTAGLIEWLKSTESVHGFEANGVKYAGCSVYNRPAKLGEAWKPVTAWYEQQEGQIDERTKLKVIRVYQALQRNPEGGSEGPYVIEDGCMYKVSHEYYWKVAELPEVPKGESGVGYRLGNVAKDDETGLWSCWLEKRERVMQEVPEYTSDNTAFAARTEQQFLGVKQDAVAETGKQASANNGVVVRRRVKKNEDCTSDVVNETEIEKTVESAVVEVRKTLKGVKRITANRSMEAPASVEELKIGDTVRNEKTQGGMYNQTIETLESEPVGETGKAVQKSALRTVTQTMENVAEKPDGSVKQETGKIIKKSVRLTDENTFDVEESEDVAHAKSSEEKTWKTADDSYEYTHGVIVYRNQETVPTPPSGKYRCTMSLSINEYGLYDAIINWTTRTENRGGGGDEGSSNSGKETKTLHYQKKDGLMYKRTVTADFIVRVETGGNIHTSMLNGAESGFGFHSHDNGRFGIKYTNITVGKEEKVD